MYQDYLAKSPWAKAIHRRYLGYKLLVVLSFGKREDYKRRLDSLVPQKKKDRTIFLLFNLMPLLIVRSKSNRKIYRLFGFLPIMKIYEW
jgi:hypothetical protein